MSWDIGIALTPTLRLSTVISFRIVLSVSIQSGLGNSLSGDD